MALGYLDDSKLYAIASAIRAKPGDSATMSVDDMPDEIGSISTGAQVEPLSVTENGTQKSFDSKASGIGSLTIKGTPAPSTDETSADASTGSGDSSSSTSASGSQKSGSANSTSTTTSGTVSTSKTTTN